MHEKKLIWVNDGSNSAKKSAYVHAHGAVQRRLRQMKETWWSATAELLQFAADCHNMKAVFQFVRKMVIHLSQIVQP